MTCSSIVNSAGLILDIVGAMLLLKFGLSSKVDPEGRIYRIVSQRDISEIEKGKLYKRWSNFAVVLLILGFLFQLISNFVKS